MIAENSYLIPKKAKKSYAQKDKYIVLVNDLDKARDKITDPVQYKFEILQSQIDKSIEEMQKKYEDVVKE